MSKGHFCESLKIGGRSSVTNAVLFFPSSLSHVILNGCNLTTTAEGREQQKEEPQNSSAEKKNTHIITINKHDGKLINHQKCEIIINTVEEKIIITPSEKSAKNIVKSFDETFKYQNKFLFSFTPETTFILIFSQKETCKKVFDIVFKKTPNCTINILNDERFPKQFIFPFFKAFQTENHMDDMLKDILAQILHSFTDKQKKFCLNALRKSEISKNLIQKYFKNTVLAANKNNKTLETFVNDDSDSDFANKTCSKNRRKTIEYSTTMIESPNFKIVECEKRNRIRPKLIIFPFKDDKTKCYEYYWYNKKSVYLCCGCGNQRKQIRAKIIDKSGNKCVKLESKEHVCKIREYNSEKYDCDPLSLILDKTKFKTFEYEKNGIIKKALVIFDSTNKDLFYEYYWRSKIERYECSGCNLKLKQISAKIFEKDGNQFVKICNRKHICELRKFNPKKFDKYEIVEAPNFEVVTYDRRGITREKLIIFPTKNRKQCHEYYWNECMKKFICLGCSNKGKQCFAKIVEKDGRKVVEIASTKHICEIREYDSKNYESKIVKAPDFKIMNRSESGDLTKSILFIFCPTNKNLGYEYSWDHRTLCYICLGCHGHSRRTTATLCKDSKGKDFVNLSKAAHICTLREYDPEKYKPNIIIRKPDFELHEQNICGSIKKKLFIYTSKELKMGYKFAYYEAKNTTPYFYCVKCKNENHTVFAQILMDNEKNEYISVKDKKHICEPIEYSSDEYENRKIVKAPRYQLIQRNFRNRIMERLIVFTDDELKMCYEYTKSKNSYKCNICIYNYKHSVFAKLIKAEDGSMEYIELGPNEHKCKPVKYEPPEALIVNLPDFKIETFTKNGSTRKSLIIFTSIKNKKLQYNYYFDTKTKTFVCSKCSKKNKRITAKLLQNEEGEEYLELNSKNHLCKPH